VHVVAVVAVCVAVVAAVVVVVAHLTRGDLPEWRGGMGPCRRGCCQCSRTSNGDGRRRRRLCHGGGCCSRCSWRGQAWCFLQLPSWGLLLCGCRRLIR
jgi:hypothetical protein